MTTTKEYLEGLWYRGKRFSQDLTNHEISKLKLLSDGITADLIDDIFDQLREEAVWSDGCFRSPFQDASDYLEERQRKFGY